MSTLSAAKSELLIDGYLRAAGTPQELLSIVLSFYLVTMETKILSEFESMILDRMILEHLKQNIKGYRLIFRATDDGWSHDAFYEKCENFANAFCIIHTEKNNVYGGYLTNGFIKENSNDPQACVYSIRTKNPKYPPKLFKIVDSKSAHFYRRGYLCCFGVSPTTIRIKEHCNYGDGRYPGRNSGHMSGQSGEKYAIPKDSRLYLTGGVYTFNTKITEIECFQVLFVD